jgi:hypothetical protein
MLMPVVALLATGLALPASGDSRTAGGAADDDAEAADFEVRSLTGRDNNREHPSWGEAGNVYVRVAEANYADDIGAMAEGPSERAVSNRVFNDTAQNVFSEGGVTQWGWLWGQFLDHTFGLREAGDEEAALAFDPDDPLESFANDLGVIDFTRSASADEADDDAVRQQTNTVSSFIDGWSVYGGSDDRLEWLREGPLDGDLSNNGARLRLTDDGYLPTADSLGDPSAAPEMELPGRLMGAPASAVVTGDVRANENIALTSLHTLFAREHNRIVDALPGHLDEQQKFEIARRVVGAEQQYITYEHFLPAMGVAVGPYPGYDSDVDPTLTNEFATVGYRAHSQIHGEIEIVGPADRFGADELEGLEHMGIEIAVDGDDLEMAIPLNLAFGNPALVNQLGIDSILTGMAGEPQYRNDEQIDNQLRSVLFQVPGPDVENPSDCLDGTELADCFSGVIDLGAIDIARGRDHGMPTYNDLRVAYGLEPVGDFAELTGESSATFPAGLDAPETDDPAALDFVELIDRDGVEVDPSDVDDEADVVIARRRSPLAARLAAIYGDVDEVDAFVGMVSEPHVDGTEFGELQLAMWTEQFTALRDGDRFFYENDPVLGRIEDEYGIDYRRSVSDLLAANTSATADEVPDDVFVLATGVETSEDDEAAADDGDAPAPDGEDDEAPPPVAVEPPPRRAPRADQPPRRPDGGTGRPPRPPGRAPAPPT